MKAEKRILELIKKVENHKFALCTLINVAFGGIISVFSLCEWLESYMLIYIFLAVIFIYYAYAFPKLTKTLLRKEKILALILTIVVPIFIGVIVGMGVIDLTSSIVDYI